jgi:membrane fusion protein (multidrug efflux system)
MRAALITALLLTGLLVPACKDKEGASQPDAHAKPVRVQAIGRGSIEDVLSYPAELSPHTEVRIFSTIPDRILDFPWNDGDEIKRGNRVALVRKEGMDQGLANMSAQVESVDVQLANLQSELERARGLLDAGAVATRAYDQLDTQHKSLVAQRKAMLAARGQLAVQAGNAYISSPIDGVVADKRLEVGDIAAPQIPLCRILGIDQLKVELRLVEADVPKVHVGQEAAVYLDAYAGRKFVGKVTTVLPYVDPSTRTNGIEITLDNPREGPTKQRLLKPGMFGRAQIKVGSRDNVVVAPEPALLLDNRLLEQQKPGETLRKAFVVDGQSVAQERVVRCGAHKLGLYEVLDGLAAGERLVVRGQHGLKDGQRVEVVEATKQ